LKKKKQKAEKIKKKASLFGGEVAGPKSNAIKDSFCGLT
jgi:hypothetical protein